MGINQSSWTLLFALAACQGPDDPDGQLEAASVDGQQAPLVTNNLWQPSDFPLEVCFRTGDGTTQQRAAVRAAVEGSWDLASDVVSFTGWGDCASDSDGDIRILLDSSISRSSSPVGTNSRSGVMSLRTPLSSPNDHLTYAYIHEFGHALGIEHEQSHPDKDTEDPSCTDDEPLAGTAVGPYDPDSIMNYCAPRLDALDDSDVVNIHRMYPFFRVHSPVLVGAMQEVCKLSDGDGPDHTEDTRFMRADGGSLVRSGDVVDTHGVPLDTRSVACESADGLSGQGDVIAVPLAAVLALL